MAYDFDTERKKQNKFEALPEGRYNVKAIKAEAKVVQASGNEMMTVTFQVGDKGEYNGRRLFDNFVLKSTVFWKLFSFFDAGGKEDFPKNGDELNDIVDAAVGLTASVFVEVEEERNRLSGYKPIPEDVKKDLEFDGDIEFSEGENKKVVPDASFQ